LRADISLLFNFFVTGQRVRRLLGDAMAPSGMKPDEYAVYSLLFEMAPLTATAMADFLGMPLSTVLDYLKAMDAAGHLEREPHPGDGRAVQLRLSKRGLAAHKRAHRYFVRAYNRFVAALRLPADRVRIALAAMDDAAQELARVEARRSASESRRSARSARARRTPAGRARGGARR
jgi:DNA-binding MarR family transcriptional regulator